MSKQSKKSKKIRCQYNEHFDALTTEQMYEEIKLLFAWLARK